MEGALLFLGTGGSTGVPLVGCSCSVCTSLHPHNQRLRSSVLLTVHQRSLLIDVGPDFRQQALRYGISHLDGLLVTHTHFDHIAGIDDLRPLNFHQKRPIPLLASSTTILHLQARCPHLFAPRPSDCWATARFILEELPSSRGEVIFCGIPIQYMTYLQGDHEVTGFRWGNFAYLIDVKQFDDDVFHDLVGVDVLVLNALRETPSLMHLSVQEAIEFSRRVGARKTYFTHIGHEMDCAVQTQLPDGYMLAYDGLQIALHKEKDETKRANR